MLLADIIPEVEALSLPEKLRLMQILISGIAQSEGVDLPTPGTEAFEPAGDVRTPQLGVRDRPSTPDSSPLISRTHP